MAREGARVGLGELDSPGHGRRTAPQLLVDEVRHAHEEDARRGRDARRIDDGERGNLPLAAEQPRGQADSEQPAVERHAAIPDLEDVGRRLQVGLRLVEEHVAEPSPENHPQHGVGEVVADPVLVEGEESASRELAQDDVTQRETEQVAEPVPVDLQRADAEEDGVDVREGDGEGEHESRRPGQRVWAKILSGLLTGPKGGVSGATAAVPSHGLVLRTSGVSLPSAHQGARSFRAPVFGRVARSCGAPVLKRAARSYRQGPRCGQAF